MFGLVIIFWDIEQSSCRFTQIKKLYVTLWCLLLMCAYFMTAASIYFLILNMDNERKQPVWWIMLAATLPVVIGNEATSIAKQCCRKTPPIADSNSNSNSATVDLRSHTLNHSNEFAVNVLNTASNLLDSSVGLPSYENVVFIDEYRPPSYENLFSTDSDKSNSK